jgi:hypothetical protein
MTAPSRFDKVLQGLEQDHHLLRIKKLLVYACYNRWESNQARLNTFSTKTLLQALLEIEPNFEQLKVYLNTVVQTLNKSAEYTLIANIIIRHIESLYLPVERSTPPEVLLSHYSETAHDLEQDQDALRIKKLLFAACGYAWENEAAKLQSVEISDLVQRLHQTVPKLVNLEAVLRSIVQTLNRQYEYTIVAHKIIQAVSHWYDTTVSSSASSSTSKNASASSETCLETSLEPGSQATSQSALNLKPHPIELNPSERFNLRLEVMKYTNPWKAKILLVSALHSPLNEPPVVTNTLIKEYELDDLFQSLFQIYPSFDDLINQLNQTARQLRSTEDQVQTVSAIARAIKPYYKLERSPQSSTQVISVTANHDSQSETIRINQEALEVEHTCQFFVAESDDRTAAIHPAMPLNASLNTTVEEGDRSSSSSASSEQAYHTFLTSVRSLFGEQA